MNRNILIKRVVLNHQHVALYVNREPQGIYTLVEAEERSDAIAQAFRAVGLNPVQRLNPNTKNSCNCNLCEQNHTSV